jgi:small GTP-binding protein
MVMEDPLRIMTDYDLNFKVLIIGDLASGINELVNRFTDRIIYGGPEPTNIGVGFCVKSIQYRGMKCMLQIWDFFGEARFKFLLSQYCKGCNGAIIMYDITNSSTLRTLSEWVQIIRNNTGDIPKILVGNNIDLEGSRAVSREEGIELAQKYNLSKYIEISTKTGENVEELFEVFTELLVEKYCY